MSKRAKKGRWTQEKLDAISIIPRNEKQKTLISSIRSCETTIALGSAGTGKTFIAASIAAELFIQGKIKKIVITRPLVSVGKTAGLLPGTIDEKLEPWFKPVTNVLIESLGRGCYEIARKNGSIEFAPFEQMQGSSFEDSFIILDEAQNCTEFELKMFLTRLGENTKAVIDGDIRQCNLRQESGLSHILKLIEQYELPVPVIEFTLEDVVRSNQCFMWLAAHESWDEGKDVLPNFVLNRLNPSHWSKPALSLV